MKSKREGLGRRNDGGEEEVHLGTKIHIGT